MVVKKKTVEYTLKNDTEQDWRVSLTTKSFTPDVHGQPEFLSELEFPYVTLQLAADETEALLPAGEEKTWTVKVAPPLGVIEKEYPLTLFFVLEPKESDYNKTEVKMEIGSNLIVLVGEGGANNQILRLQDFALPKVVDTMRQSSLALTVENQGTVGTLVSGRVTLFDSNGEILQENEFYPDLILGQKARQVRFKVTNDGATSLIESFVWPTLMWGKYRLRIQLGTVQQNAGTPTVIEKSFYALPYRAIGIGLIVLILLVLLIIKSGRKGKKTRAQSNLRERTRTMKAQSNYFRQESI